MLLLDKEEKKASRMADECSSSCDQCPINDCIEAILKGDTTLFEKSLVPDFDHQTAIELHFGAIRGGHIGMLVYMMRNGYPLCIKEDYHQRARVYGRPEILSFLGFLSASDCNIECWDKCRR